MEIKHAEQSQNGVEAGRGLSRWKSQCSGNPASRHGSLGRNLPGWRRQYSPDSAKRGKLLRTNHPDRHWQLCGDCSRQQIMQARSVGMRQSLSTREGQDLMSLDPLCVKILLTGPVPPLFYNILAIEIFIACCQIDDSFNEPHDGWNIGPYKDQIQDSHTGATQVEFVCSHTT